MKTKLKNIWVWVCIALGVLWFVFFLLGNGLLLSTEEPHTTNLWQFLFSLLCLAGIHLLSRKKLKQPMGVETLAAMTVFVYVYYTFIHPAQ